MSGHPSHFSSAPKSDMCGDPNTRKVHPRRQLQAAVTDPEGHHFSGTQLEPKSRTRTRTLDMQN